MLADDEMVEGITNFVEDSGGMSVKTEYVDGTITIGHCPNHGTKAALQGLHHLAWNDGMLKWIANGDKVGTTINNSCTKYTNSCVLIMRNILNKDEKSYYLFGLDLNPNILQDANLRGG